MKIIRTALNAARRQGLVLINAAEAVELPDRISVERGTFSAAEVKKLVDAAEGEWKTLIICGYYLGASWAVAVPQLATLITTALGERPQGRFKNRSSRRKEALIPRFLQLEGRV